MPVEGLLRTTLIAGQLHELDGIHIERIRKAGERFPGQVLRAALDP